MMQCYEAAQCGVPNVHAQAQAQAQRTCSRSESTGADHKGKSKMVMCLNVVRCNCVRRHKLKPSARAPNHSQEELFRKRSKVPGTPGAALQAGQGLVVPGDVLVTWVCTGGLVMVCGYKQSWLILTVS